ncbi:MAG: F0F1 ATP synthase subunit A, partial [Planctomycetaceae bacterium]|nr:F0F1 ATP synthase subunit A [Planctomycetaceae bacterium]
MESLQINPDEPIFRWHGVVLNETLIFTWAVMVLLVLGARRVTAQLSGTAEFSKGQNLLEVLVTGLGSQIRDVSRQEPGGYLPFVGTLFLFIAASNLLTVIPGFTAPTGSLSTTAALAACVFVAVPLFGISQSGLKAYLQQYLQPSIFMLPFNI